ncbi:CapA family protein [Gordonia sp. VNK21]|uniref:CapA family protein n=1 Tax=Gordonia sp. VNK21 TaxID=3382483 RepID=UPI0038D4DF7E
MSDNPIVVVQDIIDRLTEHLETNEDRVTRRLRRASTGELAMPETFGPGEREHVQAIFARIAEVGPSAVWAQLTPLLLDRQIVLPLWGDARAARPRPFAAIARQLPGGLFRDVDHHGGLPGIYKDHLVSLVVLLAAYIMYDEFHVPQRETGRYDATADSLEKLKWLYRYRFNQLEIAEPGSGLEDFFRTQDLDFPEGPGTTRRVSISAAGDLLAVDALTPENTERLFGSIGGFYSTADIVSATLSSTVAPGLPVGRSQPAGAAARLNTSPEMLHRFVERGGIDFFATATDHALDWGEKGVLSTLRTLARSGAAHAGTAASQAQQDDAVVLEVNGIRIGLLSFTMDLNGRRPPADKPYLVDEVRFNDAAPAPDYTLVRRQIAAARARGADYLIAYCQWGRELEMYPRENVVEAANTLIDLGIDTVLGSHPHVPQPMQRVVRDGRPDGLIVYAFGDLVSYHPESRNSKLAYTVRFDVVQEETADGTRTYLANLRMLPLYLLNAPRENNTVDCRILPFADVYAHPEDYPLSERERAELDHLHDVVLHGMLIPEGGAALLADSPAGCRRI